MERERKFQKDGLLPLINTILKCIEQDLHSGVIIGILCDKDDYM